MWNAIFDIAFVSASALALWDIAGLATFIRMVAAALTRRPVRRVLLLDNSAAIGFIASVALVVAEGEASTITIFTAAALAALNRITVNFLQNGKKTKNLHDPRP